MANVLFSSATPCHLDGDRKVTVKFLRTGSSTSGQVVTIYGYYEATPGGTQTQLFSVTHTLTSNMTQSKTITVGSSAAQTAMQNAMANASSIPLYIKLVSNGEVWGEGELVVSSDVSGPTFSAATISEENSDVQHLLNGAYFLTNESQIGIDTSSATANNYATIVRRTIVVDGLTYVLTGNQTVLHGVEIPDPGDYRVTIMITDSRGFRKIVQQTITVKKYTPIKVYGDNIERLFNVGTTAHLEFQGSYTDLLVSGSHVNSVEAMIRYKKVSDSSYTSQNLTLTISNNNHFSFSGDLSITFDENYAYDIRLYVHDALKNVFNAYVLPKATPVLALRDGKVGVNKTAPTCALDVHGTIQNDGDIQSGGNVTVSGNIVGSGNISVNGTQVTITSDIQKNNLTTPGIYWIAASDVGYYMIEVFAFDNTIIQRETMRGYSNGVVTTDVYVRSKIGSGNWTSWQQL